MNCHETYPLLHAYADGELDLVRSLDVERHLQSCADCTAARHSIESLGSTLRHSDLAYRAPQSLRQRVHGILREAKGEARASGSRQWPWQFLAFGAAAFAVLVLLLRPAGISENGQLTNEAIDGHVRSLMASHLTDVASSDQHSVKPWFDGKIDFAPDVKDYASEGFPLVGGRLDYLSDQPVAALVYRRNKHFINVFIWPAKHPLRENAGIQRGFSVLNHDSNGMHYFIVSDLNLKELTEFAGLLGQPRSDLKK